MGAELQSGKHASKCAQTIITAAGEMTYTARNLDDSCLHHRSMGNTDARTLHTECDYDLYLFGVAHRAIGGIERDAKLWPGDYHG